MIGFLSGQVLSLSSEATISNLIVLCGGVGYEVFIPSRDAQKIRTGGECALFIYTHMRADGRGESALELFGFLTLMEKKVFRLLTTVSGVGFKTALSIISALDGVSVLQAIVKQDRIALTSVPGIGKKTAERIILELTERSAKLLTERNLYSDKAKIPAAGASAVNAPLMNAEPLVSVSSESLDEDSWLEARDALIALGYRDQEIINILRKIQTETVDKNINTQTYVRNALAQLRSV